jgi:hypothetical protein
MSHHFLRMLLKRIRLLPCAIEATKLGYLRNVGWFQSMRARMLVDREGDPIPWFAYAAIHFLEERLKTLEPRCSFSVFEYGVGNSTLWWPKLGFSVTACEHDRAWFARMQRLVPNNVKLMHVDLDKAGEYASAVVSTRVVPDDNLVKSASYTISGIRIFRFPPKIAHIDTTQTYNMLIFK